MTGETPVVFVVDDDVSWLRAIERLLTLEGYDVRVWSSPADFFAVPVRRTLGCIIVDLKMPEMDGLEFQTRLRTAGYDFPVIFLTGHGDIPASVRAVKDGALDFLVKPVDSGTLLEAVKAAIAAHAEIIREVRTQEEIVARFARLTPTERAVSLLVARGLLNKQIAFELGSSERTVKIHRGRVMDKLEVESVADLVRLVDRLPQDMKAAAS